MIGNDVVDLVLAQKESNWQRKGFLGKIFTENEQEWILTHKNPVTQVWNLWTRKESIYKIYNRQTGNRAFIPLKIECFDFDLKIGKVICYDKIYFTKTETTENFIHTIAVLNKIDFEKIVYLNDSDTITKKNGIPFYNEKPVSKSHHGKFERIVTLM